MRWWERLVSCCLLFLSFSRWFLQGRVCVHTQFTTQGWHSWSGGVGEKLKMRVSLIHLSLVIFFWCTFEHLLGPHRTLPCLKYKATSFALRSKSIYLLDCYQHLEIAHRDMVTRHLGSGVYNFHHDNVDFNTPGKMIGLSYFHRENLLEPVFFNTSLPIIKATKDVFKGFCRGFSTLHIPASHF